MEEEKWEGATEVESNWFKFQAVGDKIKGTLVGKHLQESQDEVFSDQWVYKIKKEDGQIWNVGISVKKTGTIERLNKCQVGEIIGIKFESEGESAIKGGHKAKNLKVYSFGMDPKYLGEELSAEQINF